MYTSPSSSQTQVLVFRKPSPRLAVTIEQLWQGCNDSWFVCLLEPDQSSAEIHLFWTEHVQKVVPEAHLIILHEPKSEFVSVLVELAHVLKQKRQDSAMRVVLFSDDAGFWQKQAGDMWFRQVRSALTAQVTESCVERVGGVLHRA